MACAGAGTAIGEAPSRCNARLGAPASRQLRASRNDCRLIDAGLSWVKTYYPARKPTTHDNGSIVVDGRNRGCARRRSGPYRKFPHGCCQQAQFGPFTGVTRPRVDARYASTYVAACVTMRGRVGGRTKGPDRAGPPRARETTTAKASPGRKPGLNDVRTWPCGRGEVCVLLHQRWCMLTLMLHHDCQSCPPGARLLRVGQRG